MSDTAPIKQEREAAKFNQAVKLGENLPQVRAHIEQGLTDPNSKRRMVATACYLIDALCLRVGDEKDADEADTVGATTLRPEHITLHPDGTAEFRFLGKDSVLWHKKIELPAVVQQNLAELVRNARPPTSGGVNRPARNRPRLFPRISSSDVNAYLTEVLPDVTAKVFRTHHATQAVRDSLATCGITAGDLEHKKWSAVSLANLEAAVLCNHYKTAPTSWRERRQRANERRAKRKERVAICRDQVREARDALPALRVEAREKKEAAKTKTKVQRDRTKVRYDKKIERAKKKVETAKNRLERARLALDKAKTKDAVTVKKRTWNLGTSLKSYIDPRVFHEWGERVDYDVLERYYPKTLRSKFAWARGREQPDSSQEEAVPGDEAASQADI